MASSVEFEDFVVMRSPALLRTAYLLVRDRQLAEDLVQTSLAKAGSPARSTRTSWAQQLALLGCGRPIPGIEPVDQTVGAPFNA